MSNHQKSKRLGQKVNSSTKTMNNCVKIEYVDRLGIEINLKNVELNPGLRYISKLLLNSLWGKFGQRNNLSKTSVLKIPADYFELVLSRKVEISQIMPAGKDMMRVSYRERDALIKENNTSNVVVALYTTRSYFC
jgi:hypothetical protein